MGNDGKRNVFIGFIGKEKDAGSGPSRWEQWRPTVELFRQNGLPGFHCAELLYVPRGKKTDDFHENDPLTRQIIADIREVSPGTKVSVHEVPMKDPWKFEQVYTALYDYALSRSKEWDAASENFYIHIGTGTHVIRICLFLLTEARFLPGKLLQSIQPKGSAKSGSCTLIDLNLQNYDLIAERFRTRVSGNVLNLKSGISTKNAVFNTTMRQLEQVASRSSDPILITGPTGSGKTRLAGRIYEVKKSIGLLTGKLVVVNCATICGSGTGLSDLFGHCAGAFTGASKNRPGLLMEANDGMLFLDEIGELGHVEQAMLLRAIESGKFLPVGSDQESSSSFQLVAGSNRDLRRAVACGQFREDLLARLELWTFHLPGIAQRREDIEPNLDFELRNTGASLNLHLSMNAPARERFLAFATSPEAVWSKNFRDFCGAIRRMATLSEGGRITLDEVEAEIVRLQHKWAAEKSAGAANGTGQNHSAKIMSPIADSGLLAKFLSDEIVDGLEPVKLAQLTEVLRVCKSSRSMADAGRRLFKPENANKSGNYSDRMKKYLASYGLDWDMVTST